MTALLIAALALAMYKGLDRLAGQLQDAVYCDHDEKRTLQFFGLVVAQFAALFFALLGIGIFAGQLLRAFFG